LADDLWQKYGYTIGPEIDPGLLEPEIIEEG
jgi:hypothetical protein